MTARPHTDPPPAGTDPSTPPEEWDSLPDEKPSELESALLTLSMFGGLVLFGLGCLVMW